MKTKWTFAVGLAASSLLACGHGHPVGRGLAPGNPAAGNATTDAPAATATRPLEDYGSLPMSFEANHGQVGLDVDFVARGHGYNLAVTSTESVLALQPPAAGATQSATPAQHGLERLAKESTTLRMRLVGANPEARPRGLSPLPGKSHYLIGNDPSNWRIDIPLYAKVEQENVYSGIDLLYYGNPQQLEWDFTVHPGADPQVIRMRFDGVEGVRIDEHGDLLLTTGHENLRVQRPVAYQEIAGSRRPVTSSFVERQGQTIGFELGTYDTSHELIIDPVLIYVRGLSGRWAEAGLGIAADSSGHAYVTGITNSFDFPVTVGTFDELCGIDGTCVPPGSPSSFTRNDAFVTKLSPDGTTLIYSTYLGGSQADTGHDIALDAAGNAYVIGITSSADFPVTPGALQPTLLGPNSDAFVTKLDPTGSALVYSTYLGSSAGFDTGIGIAVDASGAAYLTGKAFGQDFPTTPGAFQTVFRGQPSGSHGGDAYVTKLSPSGTAIVFSTFLGGTRDDNPWGIAVDAAGNVYVAGDTGSPDFPVANAYQPTYMSTFFGANAFVAKLEPSGSTLVYSTYLGGTAHADAAFDIATDGAGNAYVTGQAVSPDFPVTPGAFDTSCPAVLSNPTRCRPSAFVARFDAVGGLVYSTYLGGDAGSESARGIAVNASGHAFVAGATSSPDFPEVAPIEPVASGSHIFVTQLDSLGSSLLFSSRVGGSGKGNDLALAVSGDIYVAATDPLGSGVAVAKAVRIGSDNQPPQALCTDLTVEAGAAVCNATETIDDGSFDPDGDPFTLTEDPSSPYGLGDTLVTLTIEDDSGASDSCLGTVTVVDQTPPSLTCQAAIALPPDSLCEAQVPAIQVTATDNCTTSADLSVVQSPAAGSTVGLGSHVVTTTATDGSGNSVNCETVVSVLAEFDGFLPPINGADATGGAFDNPVRAFKLKSTIPLKFRALCAGEPLLTGTHTLQAIHWTDATTEEEPIDATPTDGATTGNEFRLNDSQWHYNLDTLGSGMSKGIWELRAMLSDGSIHFAFIEVK